mmetsp:Transcript_1180/g.2587  ORF Transcript_1180/g.2587 Transcript_1180/m.2587 type:complete len:202 (-) Transcript_1180:464-1069(-)
MAHRQASCSVRRSARMPASSPPASPEAATRDVSACKGSPDDDDDVVVVVRAVSGGSGGLEFGRASPQSRAARRAEANLTRTSTRTSTRFWRFVRSVPEQSAYRSYARRSSCLALMNLLGPTSTGTLATSRFGSAATRRRTTVTVSRCTLGVALCIFSARVSKHPPAHGSESLVMAFASIHLSIENVRVQCRFGAERMRTEI